ncbi:hypothetical protein EPO33_03395 [Patescibacteria group bacterium]|nr:MAG: hypothetical protein EPO33_03395 [Patescibacteria group bacterium]
MSTLATAGRVRVQEGRAIDAIVVYPGVGERERVEAGIALAQCTYTGMLYLAGINAAERARGDLPAHGELVARLAHLPRPPSVEIDENGENALVQSQNTQALCSRLYAAAPARQRITLYLVVTDWHLPRAYLTLARLLLDWREAGPVPRVYPWSAPRRLAGTLSGTNANHYAGATLSDATATEYQRILAYQQKGDVATYEELLAYLQRAGLFASDAE